MKKAPKAKGKAKAKLQKDGAMETQKILCAMTGCKSKCNVKNSKHCLPRKDVQLESCRELRSHCQLVKFCCAEHLTHCSKPVMRKAAEVGSEALTTAQLACLFVALQDCGYVWAATLMLLQLFLGERADCARSCRVSWLMNVLSLSERQGQSLDLPRINIPPVNGKTVSGIAPLDRACASLFRGWMEGEPCKGASGSQWPFQGQTFQDPNACLFPGKDTQTQKRCWETPITERAYHHALRTAVKSIVKARKTEEDQGRVHVFSDIDLERLGTHCVKKSRVSLLTEAGASMTLISAITRTSVAVLKKHYDVPTNARKRDAIGAALGPVICSIQQPSVSKPPADAPDEFEPSSRNQRWCPYCGEMIQSAGWLYCFFCGKRLPSTQ